MTEMKTVCNNNVIERQCHFETIALFTIKLIPE